MKKLTAFILLCLAPVTVAARAQQPADSDSGQLFVQIQEILTELSEISGLKAHHKIDYDLIDKAKVKQFLEDRIREAVKPEELHAEELTLKKFGFVPRDFDLKKTTIDLLTEQAAAFYDFKKKKLFVLDSAPSGLQQIALVHELAHALADQNFNLEKFIDNPAQSDDSSTARMAVMEGQATWLMSEYLARRGGQSLKTSPSIVQLMSHAAEMSAGQFPVFDAAPLYMRESLMFPYSQGMLFQHAVFEKEGQAAFSEVFRRPPLSSQQVLHPEKYFANVKPASPPLPALTEEKQYEELARGTIGELDHSILLRQYADKEEAEKISPRWKGGQYRVMEHKKDKHTALLYAVEWETPEVARQYFQLYQKVLKGKWKTMEVTGQSSDSVAGRGDDGYFLLRREGPRVTSIEGALSPLEAGKNPAIN